MLDCPLKETFFHTPGSHVKPTAATTKTARLLWHVTLSPPQVPAVCEKSTYFVTLGNPLEKLHLCVAAFNSGEKTQRGDRSTKDSLGGN